jgi:small conductance mechanosensitive channel
LGADRAVLHFLAVSGAHALAPIALATSVAANDFPPSAHDVLSTLRDWLPAIGWSVAILVATYLVSRLASGRLRRGLTAGGLQINVAILLGRTLWVALWLTGFLLVLSVLGVGLTPVAAFVGVVGLAASLSLQAVLQNLVAGIYLLAERPFAIGDFIAVIGPTGATHEGRVEDLQMRTTHLRSRDDELILVPNSVIFTGVVTNRTAVGSFVQHLSITFPRDTDITVIRPRVLDLLEDLPAVVPAPVPRLRVDRVDADRWTVSLSVWARSSEAASDTIWALARAFPEATVNDEEPT